MICIQKIYGFHGLNHQIIEESWDVTPVTNERTDGGRRKVENSAVFWIESETAIEIYILRKKMGWRNYESRRFCISFLGGLLVPGGHLREWHLDRVTVFESLRDLAYLLLLLAHLLSQLANTIIMVIFDIVLDFDFRENDMHCIGSKPRHYNKCRQ